MINAIPKTEVKRVEAFENGEISKTSAYYWIPAEPAVKEDAFISNINSVIIPPSQARKTNNIKIIGYSVAGAVVLTAGTIFFLLKGGPKGFSKAMKNAKNYFETKLAESALSKNKNAGKRTIVMSKIFNNAFKHADAVNNFTTLKDLLFKKIMNITPISGKIHDSITKLFLKIGARAVRKSYGIATEKLAQSINLTNSSVIKNSTSLNEIIKINGVEKTKKEWLSEIAKLNTEIVDNHNKSFGSDTVSKRYHDIINIIPKKLLDKFKHVKTLFNKDNITRFAADNAVYEDKMNLRTEILKGRNKISYNPNNLFNEANEIILNIAKNLKNKDLSELGEIRNLIKDYIKSGTDNIEIKERIFELIEKFDKQHKGTNVYELKNLINNYRQGLIERILEIQKVLCSKDDYRIIEKTYKGYLKTLDKSIRIESEDFINKLRDLTMGSAPTDVLTMLGSLFVLGYELVKSEDNKQRQSIALKYGFPALSGIAVSLYCNANLFAGSKSLIVGGVSTFLLNRSGKWLDDKLKAKIDKQIQNSNQEQ